MSAEVPKSTKKSQKPKSPAKRLRDQNIMTKAISGTTNTDIAKELGLNRKTVTRVMNSEEVKAKVAYIETRLAEGIEDAINTILKAVKQDPLMAEKLLKNFGSMKSSVLIQHGLDKTLEDLVAGSMKEGNK